MGSRSLLNEVELVEIVERVFRKLGIAVTLKMNNRKMCIRDRVTSIPCRNVFLESTASSVVWRCTKRNEWIGLFRS